MRPGVIMRAKARQSAGDGGNVVIFPGGGHGRTSTASDSGAFRRAAKLASSSIVSPAVRPTSEPTIAGHHSGEMKSRCGHLRAAHTPAPTAEAMSAGVFQSATTSRKDEMGVIAESNLGPFVLNSKTILSYDCGTGLGDNAAMAKRASESEENEAFIARVRAAREAKFSTQKPVYQFLGITQGQYKHYETGRPLQRRYVPKFCIITEVSMEWLLTGEGEGPALTAEAHQEPAKRRGRKGRSKAA